MKKAAAIAHVRQACTHVAYIRNVLLKTRGLQHHDLNSIMLNSVDAAHYWGLPWSLTQRWELQRRQRQQELT